MLSTAMTLGDAVRMTAKARPRQEVFVCGSVRLTNAQLLDRIDALARGLAGLGIGTGDRIAALLPAGPEFAFLFFAVATIGGVIVPLNPELRERALRDILEDARPAALVTSVPVPEAVTRNVPSLRHVVSAEGGLSGLSLAALMQAASGSAAASPPRSPASAAGPGSLAALLYTSGTTGTPKATMHTHASLIAPVLATLKVREQWGRPTNLRMLADAVKAVTRYRGRVLRAIGRPQVIMSTTGWHTMTGLHVMLQGLLMGDKLVAMSQFHPGEALEIAERERVTVLIAVPTAWRAMLAVPRTRRYDFSSLLVCASGGAPCPAALVREIRQCFGCAPYNGFGMTEAGGGISVSSLADSDEQQEQTVGKVMPGISARIVDSLHRDLPPGQVGELAVRGGGVMLGYHEAPQQTAMVKDDDGWLYTGDIASIDEKGYLRIIGRAKDVIIRGGQNIYPAEIEGWLCAHPKIEEAAVVGVPSAVAGETVWAFIRLKQGAGMTVTEVLNHCRGTLEIYKIPSEVRFVAEFPRAETGKSQKFKLRELAIRELEGGAT